jgi:hypothetical protein
VARSRRNRDQDPDSIQVPFEDAQPGDGEFPLAKLDEFMVPSRDNTGSSSTITISIPPILDRQLEVLVSSKRFPYATKRDLIRHGVVRHSVWLLTIRESVPRHVQSMCDAIIELCRDDEIATKMEQVFQLLRHRVSHHIDNGDHMEAVGLISQVKQMLREMKPSVWVRKFTQEFDDQFGGYLRLKRREAKAVKEEEEE